MKYLVLFLKGIAIGAGGSIPGMSGGTLAVVFNIYDEFVNAITLNVKRLWRNRGFILPLLLGVAAGLLLFSFVFSTIYEAFPLQTDYLFTGLILGSVPLILRYARRGLDFKRLTSGRRVSFVLCALAGFAAIVLFSFAQGQYSAGAMPEALPTMSAALALRLVIAGFVSAVAMIIPAVSGSLILLIMGVYGMIIASISSLLSPDTALRALLILAPSAVGIIAGLLAGARLISFLLRRVPNHTYFAILGLLVGSAGTLIPLPIRGVATIISCVLCLAAGCALSYFCSRGEVKGGGAGKK